MTSIETYVAGFGGYTFGGKISDVEGTGFLSGLHLNDRDLADSGVYGGKVGHFFGDRMDWLGVEMEAFITTPHVEQQGLVPGSHFRVTTLAFNLIGRLKLGCKMRTERTEPRSRREGIRDRICCSSLVERTRIFHCRWTGVNGLARSGNTNRLNY